MNIVDKIRTIKESRLSYGEKKFIVILNNLVEYRNEKYPNHIFYKLNNDIVIEHDLELNFIWFGDTHIINPLYNTCYNLRDVKSLIIKLYKPYNNVGYLFKFAFNTKQNEWESLNILQSNLKTNNNIDTIK